MRPTVTRLQPSAERVDSSSVLVRRPLPAIKPSLSTCWLVLRCSPSPPTPRRPPRGYPLRWFRMAHRHPPSAPPRGRWRSGPRARAPRRPTPVRMRRTLPQPRPPQAIGRGWARAEARIEREKSEKSEKGKRDGAERTGHGRRGDEGTRGFHCGEGRPLIEGGFTRRCRAKNYEFRHAAFEPVFARCVIESFWFLHSSFACRRRASRPRRRGASR